MSANFLDVSGAFAGADLHLYWPGPPPAPPVLNLHAVASLHIFIWNRPWRWVTTVTTGHCAVLQSGWAMILVPHIPIPIPPNPVAEGANLACVILTSSSSPQISAHSVTGKGTALCTALLGPMGLHTDCGVQFLPTGIDVNLNSVKTSPTLGDYAAAVVGMVLNGMYNQLTGVIQQNPICYLVAALQNLSDLTGLGILDPVTWVINQITGVVQSGIDGPNG